MNKCILSLIICSQIFLGGYVLFKVRNSEEIARKQIEKRESELAIKYGQEINSLRVSMGMNTKKIKNLDDLLEAFREISNTVNQ